MLCNASTAAFEDVCVCVCAVSEPLPLFLSTFRIFVCFFMFYKS